MMFAGRRFLDSSADMPIPWDTSTSCCRCIGRGTDRRHRGPQPVAPTDADCDDCARFGNWIIPAPGGKHGGIVQNKQSDLPTDSHSNLDSLLDIPWGTAVMLATPDRRHQLLLLSMVVLGGITKGILLLLRSLPD